MKETLLERDPTFQELLDVLNLALREDLYTSAIGDIHDCITNPETFQKELQRVFSSSD